MRETMRVFEMVAWPERTIPEKSTPAAESKALSSRISASLPQKPACSTLTPRPTRFIATLAAPPGALVVRTERSTGTGASGEMRSTSPQMERSNITSPITNTRRAANPLSIRERRRDCSFTSIPSSSQIRSRSRDWPILRGTWDRSIHPTVTALWRASFPNSETLRQG